MVDSVGSSRGSRRRPDFSASMYRTSRQLSTPKAPTDPLASEILSARHQLTQNRRKVLAARNRIRMLETMQQNTVRNEELQRRTAAFRSGIRERKRVEEMVKERFKAERQAEELDNRIKLLRDKQERSMLISTARSRVLSEKRETVEEIKRVSEQLDMEIEMRREQERQRNAEKRRLIATEIYKKRQERTLSAQSHKEMLKSQYRQRLEAEKKRAEEEAHRLAELERALEGHSQQQSVE